MHCSVYHTAHQEKASLRAQEHQAASYAFCFNISFHSCYYPEAIYDWIFFPSEIFNRMYIISYYVIKQRLFPEVFFLFIDFFLSFINQFSIKDLFRKKKLAYTTLNKIV